MLTRHAYVAAPEFFFHVIDVLFTPAGARDVAQHGCLL